jgi:hypothetical protein
MVLFCSCISPILLPFGLIFFLFISIIIYQIIKISEYASKNSKLKVKPRNTKSYTKKHEYKPDVGIILIPAIIIFFVIGLFFFSYFGPLLIIFIFIIPLSFCGAIGNEMNKERLKYSSISSRNKETAPNKSIKQKQKDRRILKYHEKEFCAKCGMKLGDDALFCHNCGKSKNTEVRFCQYCGKNRIKHANFCDKCGNLIMNLMDLNTELDKSKITPLPEEIKYCRSCGEERNWNEKFCSQCGGLI